MALSSKIIICVSVVVSVVLACALVYVIHHNHQHSRRSTTTTTTPSLTLTSVTALNSTTWSFSQLVFSDPSLVNNSLAVAPMFSYNNSSSSNFSSQLTYPVIGKPILFHPDGRQATFSGYLNLDRVSHDVSPFLMAQQDYGYVHAAVNVALFASDGGVHGWVCLVILRANAPSSPSSKCISANPA